MGSEMCIRDRYKSKADSDGVVRFWNGSAWAGDPIDKSLLVKRLAPYQYSLAPGMDRFLARLIDWFVWGAFYLVSDIVVDFFSLEPGLGQAIKLVGFATLVALYEAYFVSKNGATVGKRFLGVRIVPLEALDSGCLLYTSPSPRDRTRSRMPSSA